MAPRKSTSSTATKSPARSPSTSSTASTPSKPRARARSTSAKKSKLSEHQYLTYGAYTIAALFIGFGLNAIFRPKPALTFFEVDYPILPKQQTAVDVLSAVYGSRDVFVGVTILIAGLYANRKTLAATVIGAGSLGIFDGLLCFVKVGNGQWNHLGWAPLVTALGALLLGVADKK
jgi:hypothetical protein